MKFRRKVVLVLTMYLFSIMSASSADALTVKEEMEISREFMGFVYQHYEMIKDPEIAGYVQKLGDDILSRFPPQPFKYHFYVIKDDTFNAFAGPGARIFIHSGLFMALESEDELAGIIGHEISHAACRHISKNIARSKKIGIGTLAGVAAGIFLGLYGDPAAGSAVTMGSIAGSQSLSLAYSREDEMQADQMGLRHLTEAGYDAHGLITSLDKIRSKQWFGKDQIPVYMMTHPAPEDRMGNIKNWLDLNSEKIPDTSKKDTFDFRMAKTKLTASYGELESARNQYKQKLDKEPDNLFALYGYGIVQERSGKSEEAIRYIKMAVEQRAFNISMLKTLGKIYFKEGHYANSLGIFEGTLSQVPHDIESNLYYGRSLAESGRLDDAVNTLKPFASDEKGVTEVYYYLGDIFSRKGDVFESCYYLGMYYRNRGDFKNATLQFKRALNLTDDKELKEKINGYVKTMSENRKRVDRESEAGSEKEGKQLMATHMFRIKETP